MNKLFTTVLTIFAFLLLNVVGLAAHASPVPMASHEMGDMNHEAGSSINCATACRAAVLTKEEAIARVDEELSDEPLPLHYTQLQTTILEDKSIKSRLYAINVKPPPKIPLYILYGVIRV